jgi:TatA/E family protein of Tat protein translocase
MFGIGMPELLLVLAVALIVIGPKKLPDLARSLGRALGEFKKATEDLKGSLGVDEEIGDVKKAFDDMNREVRSAVDVNPLKKSPTKKKEDPEKHTPAPTEAEEPIESSTKPDSPDSHTSQDDAGGDAKMSDLKSAFDDLNDDSATAATDPSDSVRDKKP